MAIYIREYSKHLWAIKSSNYSPALRTAAKETPGMSWEPTERAWVGYVDAVAACSDILRAKGIRLQGEIAAALDGQGPSALLVAYKGLRDYQQAGVRFLLREAPTGALLADDMGLGKSAVALRAARALKLPTVIVCPAFVQGVWGADEDSEVKKWWPEAWPPRVLEGVKGGMWRVRRYDEPTGKTSYLGNRPAASARKYSDLLWLDEPTEGFELPRNEAEDVVKLFSPRKGEPFELATEPVAVPPTLVTVCNDSILYAWAPHMPWCRFLVIDEVHHAANDKSRRSKAMRMLAQGASHRAGLSGTPMTNRPRDLWNVVDTLSENRFGKFFPYAKRYCDAHREEVAKDKVVWKFDGASNLEELNARLKHFMLRRTKAEVGMQLPPKTRQLLYVQVKRRALAPATNLIINGKINDKAFRKALDMAADGKLVDVVGLVASHVQENHRVVVFTYRRRVAEFICDALLASKVNATFIHGELSHKERQVRMKKAWDVLCATIDVTAGGISLTQADVGVFAEMTYEPHEILQCEARLHRFGQTENTLFQYVLGRGTVDEIVAKVVLDKLDVFEKAVGPTGEGWQDTMRQETDRKKVLKALAARLLAAEE